MLREQLVAEQESSADLIEQVDELKRKTEKTETGLRSLRYSNRRSTISYMRISCVSALLLVTLSHQLCWLDTVNICGLMCVLMCWFDVVKLLVGCC